MLLSVSELNEYVRKSLAMDPFIQNIRIKGEISNLKKYYSGHWYFTLKDDESAVNCVMFSQNNRELLIAPEDGMAVELKGSVSLYVKTGQYQFYATDMIVSGIGELFLRYEKLKDKLFKQGMFDEGHKKVLPLLPRMIGVVTSASGAVIHDILHVAEKRNSNIPICLYPAKVQGAGASEDIIRGIRYFNVHDTVDVIIIGRGGGSFEDLFEFNSEALAQEIYRSKKPIISAVGHETDYTIADFVADKRAATPSQAAEIAVIERSSLLVQLHQLTKQLSLTLHNHIAAYSHKLQALRARIASKSPRNHISIMENRLSMLRLKLRLSSIRCYEDWKHRLSMYQKSLQLLHPDSVLRKGYAIIEKNGLMMDSVQRLHINDRVQIRMHDGHLAARIEEAQKKTQRGAEYGKKNEKL